jgi:hypothetical protein
MKYVVELTHLCQVNSWRVVEADSLSDLMTKIPEMSTGDSDCDHEVVGDMETTKITVKRIPS